MRFCRPDKGGFIGREATLESMEKARSGALPWVCVQVEVEAGDADAHASETVYCRGEHVGQVSSGGFGFRVRQEPRLLLRADMGRRAGDRAGNPGAGRAAPGHGPGWAGIRCGGRAPADGRGDDPMYELCCSERARPGRRTVAGRTGRAGGGLSLRKVRRIVR